jgi:hypothetical protein
MSTASPVAPMFFISYRRDDSAGHVGRLYDALVAHFGRQRLFFDIDHIAPGQDFVQVLDASLNRCSVLLVVIGKRWAGTGRVGGRRIDQADDFVRLEVAAALRRQDLRVIPVLIQGTKMPSPASLPDDLKDLARRNATELSDTRWKEDIARLIASLEADRPRTEANGERILRLAKRVWPTAQPSGWRRPALLAAAGLLVVALAVAAFSSHRGAEAADTATLGSPAIPRSEPLVVPSRLDEGVKLALPAARKWRPDAQLTEIATRLPDSTADAQVYLTDFTFRSASDGAGLNVTAGPFRGLRYSKLQAVARAAIRPLADSFLPLPVAVDSARAAGMFGPVQSARLAATATGTRTGRPTWTITPAQAGQARSYYVDGVTGQRVSAAVKRTGGLLGKVERILH